MPPMCWPRRYLVVAVGALLMTAAGCASVGREQPASTPIPTPAQSNKAVYTVGRTSIAQVVKATGRVAASQEAQLYFRHSGRLRRIYVDPNQQVKQGDLLAELDPGSIQMDIDQQKLKLDVAEIGLAQALRQAGSNTSAIAEARARIDKADADYARALSDLEKLKAGPTPADVASAERSVASAETDFARAQSDLNRLRAGPLPEDVRAAELGLEQARDSLWSAQIRRDGVCGSDPSTIRCKSAGASVAAAETSVTRAQLALESAKAPARPDDVANAERSVATARASLDSARAGLEQVTAGPERATVVTADRAVASARSSVDAARASYDQLLATSSAAGDQDVQIERDQVGLARASLEELQEQLSEGQIRAPFAGVVMSTQGREGDRVEAFAPVASLANPVKVQLRVELTPEEFRLIQLGQEATIVFTAFPTNQIAARVSRMSTLSASLNPQAPVEQRTLGLDFAPPAGRALELGSLANVQILSQRKVDVLTLPKVAIRIAGSRKFVSVLTASGRKQEMDVELGISSDTEAEVLSGVEEGQRVIGQ